MGDSEDSPLLKGSSSTATKNGDEQNESTYGTSETAHNDVSKVGSDEEAQEEDRNEPLYEGMPEVKAKLKWIVPSISVGIFLAAADQTIIVACYGKIGSDLNSLSNTSWIAAAYYLTLTSIQPLYGKLSDIFGRKSCLLFAYAIFGLGCLFCGLARNMNELIAARAFAGIGGGGMTTVVSILMSDIVPLRERGIWQGIINIIFASGSGLGAPLGGLLADLISWRWAFLLQAPLCAIAFTSVTFILKLPAKDVVDWKTKFRRIDFAGAFVLVAAVFSLIFGLDRGANGEWSNIICIVPLCLSFPLFALFILIELKLASEPFAPGYIIFERSLFACYLCNFFSFAGWMGMIFYLPLFYQAVDQLSASQAGLWLLPGIVASVSGSLSGGLIMKKTGKYYWLTVFAYSILTLAAIPILLCANLVVKSAVGISIGLFFSGYGAGIGVTTSLIALIANASSEDQAVATACSYLFRSLGSVVGLSLAATVVQQSLKTQLQEQLRSAKDAASIEKHVRESLDFIKTLEPGIQRVVRECYGASVRNGFILLIVTMSFAAASSCKYSATQEMSVCTDKFFLVMIREKRLSK